MVSRGDAVAEIETEKVNMEVEAYDAGTLHILAPEGSTHEVGAHDRPTAQGGRAAAAAPVSSHTAPVAAASAVVDAPATLAVGDAPPDFPAQQTPGPATAPAEHAPGVVPGPCPRPRRPQSQRPPEARWRAPAMAGSRPRRWPGAWPRSTSWTSRGSAGGDPADGWSSEDVEVAIQARRYAAPAPPPRAAAALAAMAAPATVFAPAAHSRSRPARCRPGTCGSPRRDTRHPARREPRSARRSPQPRPTHRRPAPGGEQAGCAPLLPDGRGGHGRGARPALHPEQQAAGSVKVSVNDLVIKAAAWALGRHPDLNCLVPRREAAAASTMINISVAVALDDGLVSPGDRRTWTANRLARSRATSRAMIERARSGKLRPEDMSEGTFTISNLGMFDIDNFIAIINPPQAAILAVGVGARGAGGPRRATRGRSDDEGQRSPRITGPPTARRVPSSWPMCAAPWRSRC